MEAEKVNDQEDQNSQPSVNDASFSNQICDDSHNINRIISDLSNNQSQRGQSCPNIQQNNARSSREINEHVVTNKKYLQTKVNNIINDE